MNEIVTERLIIRNFQENDWNDMSGNPLWVDTCLYGILNDEWK